jgi:hypothetical protein
MKQECVMSEALPDFPGPRGRVVVPIARDVLEGELGLAHRRRPPIVAD